MAPRSKQRGREISYAERIRGQIQAKAAAATIHHGWTNRRRRPRSLVTERGTGSRDGEHLSRGQEDVTGLSRHLIQARQKRRKKSKQLSDWSDQSREGAREGERRANREIAVVRPKIPSVPIKQVTAEEEGDGKEDERRRRRRFGVRGTMTARKNRTDSNRKRRASEGSEGLLAFSTVNESACLPVCARRAWPN